MKIAIIKSKSLSIWSIKPNNGQIDGVPKNPRLIKDNKYQKLKKSIQDNPEMLGARELLVYQLENDYVIIGGNMRFQACKELGYKELPCKILPPETTAEQLRAYIIKDNVSFGENDWDIIANEWETEELSNWGMEIYLPEQESFTPNYNPSTGTGDVTESDITDAEQKNSEQFQGKTTDYIECVCPNCGNEFNIQA